MGFPMKAISLLWQKFCDAGDAVNKTLLLFVVLLLFSACVSQTEKAPAVQPKTSVTEEVLTRTSAGSAVSVDVAFLNPIQKNKEELIFKVALNTHSVDLSGFRIDQLAAFRNSEGVEAEEGFIWVSESESSHHRSGYLKIPAKTKDGKPLISEETEYIILEISGIEAKREFKWEKDILQ